jgi:hypothetical protein
MTKIAAHTAALKAASLALAFVLFAPIAAAVLMQAAQVIA